ncbi:hypothetical protein PILCRDRAFT_804222 [Piloderma croceum F 1598]|uniref:Uncharacterized protein n=1 Tax=Piloderma croceum (strain F 1598) TaxID=765440 RepID=A0A0C3EW19_PILCF|nr:hypothetical protein PILCRDRAFT_804222 [Piloderma croceum F 1598]
MSSVPSDVYARQLLVKHYGYPLFVPEPDDGLPVEYRNKGTSIGDVGIITPDGSFDFLFNICVPANDPVNCYGVPDGFEHVLLDPGKISLLNNIHPPGSDVSSASVKRANISLEYSQQENEILNIPAGVGIGYKFTTSSTEAAILSLPEGASRQNIRNLAKFRSQGIKNTLRWYQFANGTLGREAPNGSLYLVTGCDKSAAWGIASISGASETSALSFKFTAAHLIEASAAFTYSWEMHCPATVRIGPEPCGNPGRLQNQCVFLHGFKMAVQEGLIAALKGSAKLSSVVNAKPGSILQRSNGIYIPFMNGGQWSWSGKCSGTSGLGGGWQLTQSESESSDIGDEVHNERNIILELVPSNTEVYHPLNVINKYLLATIPEAQVIVTHKSDWWALSDNSDMLPSDDELLARLPNWYRPLVESATILIFVSILIDRALAVDFAIWFTKIALGTLNAGAEIHKNHMDSMTIT